MPPKGGVPRKSNAKRQSVAAHNKNAADVELGNAPPKLELDDADAWDCQPGIAPVGAAITPPQQQFSVTVPPGVASGQTIQIDIGGQLLQVQVPAGMVEGNTFMVAAPAPAPAPAPQGSSSSATPTVNPPLSPRHKVFAEAAQIQLKNPGTGKAAEHVHTKLAPQFWGVGKLQLQQFERDVREAMKNGAITNMTKEQCAASGYPERYYDQKKFDNKDIGPNMHQVNAMFIVPETKKPDANHNISNLSYSCMVNSRNGLLCDLFVSHAWDEGVFEFSENLLAAWPQNCFGAYICFLSNPQNLLDLISKQIKKPTDSPFYKVLKNNPNQMMMVPNSNTPIHSRLWCVYEAYCAVTLNIPVQVAGDPSTMVMDAAAVKSMKATQKKQRNQDFGLIVFFVFGVMFAPPLAFVFPFLLYWLNKKRKQQMEEKREAHLRVVDVNNAKCSMPSDQEAIRKEIQGHEDRINQMVRSFIPNISMGEPPSFCMKCCCPPVAVIMHEGAGCSALCALCLCQWYTLCCWEPKKFENDAPSYSPAAQSAPQQQQMKM